MDGLFTMHSALTLTLAVVCMVTLGFLLRLQRQIAVAETRLEGLERQQEETDESLVLLTELSMNSEAEPEDLSVVLGTPPPEEQRRSARMVLGTDTLPYRSVATIDTEPYLSAADSPIASPAKATRPTSALPGMEPRRRPVTAELHLVES